MMTQLGVPCNYLSVLTTLIKTFCPSEHSAAGPPLQVQQARTNCLRKAAGDHGGSGFTFETAHGTWHCNGSPRPSAGHAAHQVTPEVCLLALGHGKKDNRPTLPVALGLPQPVSRTLIKCKASSRDLLASCVIRLSPPHDTSLQQRRRPGLSQLTPEVCLLALLGGGGSGGSIDAAVPYSSSTTRMMLSTLSRSFLDGPSAAGGGIEGSFAAASADASDSCGPSALFPARNGARL